MIHFEDEKEKLYKLSGFRDLENYIKNVLNDGERVRMKFLNVINIGDRMLCKYKELCSGTVNELDSKISEVNDLEMTKQQYSSEMKAYLDLNYKDIDRVLWDMKAKACVLIDDTVRVTNLRILFNQKKFAEKFAKEVIDDINVTLERKINYMIDYFSDKNNQSLEKIRTELINKFSSIKGLDYTSKLERQRRDILDSSVGSFASKHNGVDNITKIVEEVRTAFWNTIAIELAAIFGVGAVAHLSAIALLPIEPIIFTSATVGVSILGFGILPWKRKRLKNQFDQKTNEASKNLKRQLDDYFQNEINQSLSRINSVIEPHHVMVKSERDRIDKLVTDINDELDEVKRIKKEIDGI